MKRISFILVMAALLSVTFGCDSKSTNKGTDRASGSFLGQSVK